MYVKICGLTSVFDALFAVQAGATHIGLNFYPKSVRYVSNVQAEAISNALRRLPTSPCLVGVFVNASLECVQTALDSGMLDLAQLHGDESPEYHVALGARAFRAYRLKSGETLAPSLSGCVPDLLVDAAVSGQYGGTGHKVDFPTAEKLARQYKLFLAGGLTADNVAEAVAAVRPWGVDVASGVESSPGVKDLSRVSAFLQAALR